MDLRMQNETSPVQRFLAWSTGHFYKNMPALLLAVATYIAAALAIGRQFLPDSPGFTLLLIWAAAQLGGVAVKQVRLPPLMGMLLSGVVLANLPGNLIDNLPDSWSTKIRAGALAVILMRSGLELDIGMLTRTGGAAVRLTVCPGVIEALAVGAVAVLIFSMPFGLALTLGFILAAVSPAIVVSGMFELQTAGFGVKKGIPSIVVAAASFDDVVAITGYSLCIGLAVPSGKSLAMDIAHGPINIIAGLVGGSLAGVVVGSTALWHNRMMRTAATLIFSQLVMFAAVYFHYTGAGAMGALIMAIVATRFWASDRTPRWFSSGSSSEYAHETEHDVAFFWRLVAQPLLFGIIGTAADFSVLSPSSIPKALLVIACGVAVRLPTAWVVTFGANLNIKERLFIAGSWIPKATVQAALASTPLDMILEFKSDEPDFQKWKTWGKDITTTAIFAIIITAPIGLVFISYYGDKWLSQDNVKIQVNKSMHQLGQLAGCQEDMSKRVSHSSSIESVGPTRRSTHDSVVAQTPAVNPVIHVPGADFGLQRSSSVPRPPLGNQRGSLELRPGPTLATGARALHRSSVPLRSSQPDQSEVAHRPDSGRNFRRSLSAMQSQALPLSLDQKAVQVYQIVMENVEAILCVPGADKAIVNRVLAIRGAMVGLKHAQTEVSLGWSAVGIQASDGTAGNFFRFARRTVLDDLDDTVPGAPPST
eukprot:jgi/Ulvmu1/5256/UM022_0049.1